MSHRQLAQKSGTCSSWNPHRPSQLRVLIIIPLNMYGLDAWPNSFNMLYCLASQLHQITDLLRPQVEKENGAMTF